MDKGFRSKKAFTLVELVLILGLILVLITIATVGLRQGKLRAKNARIANDISQLRKVSEEIYYQSLDGYKNLCESQGGTLNSLVDSRIESLKNDIQRLGGGIICYCNKENYCISIDLPGTSWYYCLDSRGNFGKSSNNSCSSASSVCPSL